MSNFNTNLGIKIKELRKRNNLSQEEFCKMLGTNYNRSTISKIEKGKITPSAEFIKNIIEVFKISSKWLFDIESIDDTEISTVSINYREVDKIAKEQGFTPEDIKEILETIARVNKRNNNL